MEKASEIKLPREQKREVEKLRSKAMRVKIGTLKNGVAAMERNNTVIPFLRGLDAIDEARDQGSSSPLYKAAFATALEVLEERQEKDREMLRKAVEGQEPLEVERGGTTYQRLGSAVEDGVLTETFAITHRGRKARLVSLHLEPGGLSNEDIVNALECIYSIVLGTDSGVQIIDARSTVKVQEIIANDEATPRLKGIALYSTFDQTLYNIDWSSDPRVSAIDIEPFFHRRDRIRHYNKEMERIFEREIRGA